MKNKNTVLLFSITAHESVSAINDLVDSILLSHSNSYIVFHITEIWKTFNTNDINLINERVFINPTRYNITEKYQGQTGCNISNIEFFNTLNIKYDYVILVQSNELYVSPIDIDYIIKHQYGANHSKTPENHYIRGIKLSSFLEIAEKNGRWNGYVEGMFFSKNIADYLIPTYRNYYGNEFNIFVCDHEQLLHTMLYNFVEDNNVDGLCLMRISETNTFEAIINFIDTQKSALIKQFSCKRIDRHNRELRNKIMKLIRNNE
jgi:hypothetical protein